MRKRVFLAVFLLMLSLFMLQGLQVLEANPVPWPSAPIFDKPTITVQIPQNNTVFAYNATDVWLNFTVAEPNSWIMPNLIPVPAVQVESVQAQLDGNNISLTWSNGGGVSLAWNRLGYSAKLNLNQTAPGLHSLNVTLLLESYYRGPAYNGTHTLAHHIYSSSGQIYQYPWTISETVYFTVEQPTPTQNIPTINTGSMLPVELNPTVSFTILAVIVTAAIASALLVFFKKRKPKLD
jgi:hypothetical protein